MNTKKILLAAVLLAPFALQAQQGFTIHGKIGHLNSPAKAYLRYGTTVDSAEISNGSFQFSGKVAAPASAVLSVKHQASDPALQSLRDGLSFYLENASIKVSAVDSIKKASIKGSLLNDEDKELNKLLQPTKAAISDLYKKWTNVKRNESNAEAYDKAAASLKNLMADQKQLTDSFIAAHPNSYIALVAFRNNNLGYNFDPLAAEATFNKFNNELKTSALGKGVNETIQKNKRTVIGVKALDFVQDDTSGHPVHLSDYRGKYVLVDFWASWCGPCRAENPNVVKAYNAMKGKNFEIIGVSLDDSKKAWENAIAKDGLPWIHVSDLKGWKNEIAMQFGISAVPQNLLIDPQGMIIAKNLRGEDLYAKLRELIK